MVEAFQDLKLKKKYKFIIFKMSDDNKEIVVEKTVESAKYDDFVASLPAEGCRYCVYDFQYDTAGEGTRNKILFYTWYFISTHDQGLPILLVSNPRCSMLRQRTHFERNWMESTQRFSALTCRK